MRLMPRRPTSTLPCRPRRRTPPWPLRQVRLGQEAPGRADGLDNRACLVCQAASRSLQAAVQLLLASHVSHACPPPAGHGLPGLAAVLRVRAPRAPPDPPPGAGHAGACARACAHKQRAGRPHDMRWSLQQAFSVAGRAASPVARGRRRGRGGRSGGKCGGGVAGVRHGARLLLA